MRFAVFKDLTRLNQTLFGLPFVLSGAFLGSGTLLAGTILLWVIPAFMFARVSGMAFNQLIDRHIDASNPRTQNRALPTGRVSVVEARIVAWGALCLFIVICLQMSGLTALLSLLAAALIYIYSYMKRVHASCHLVLACIHFLGPVMAFSAVTGTYSPGVLFLGAAAALSILGTDIVYAIQDYAFDCAHGLFSIPSRLGPSKSMALSAVTHCLCVVMLIGVGLSAHLSWVYYLIIPCVGGAFGCFHYLAHKYPHTLEIRFFLCNVIVSGSTLLGIVGGAWDVLL